MTRPPPSTARLLAIASSLPAHGRPAAAALVFTNGCFDILHRGTWSTWPPPAPWATCSSLGLNTDAFRRPPQGPHRPYAPLDDRAGGLAALTSVDVITPFDADTPHALIAALLPDVLVKGGDYAPDEMVGREEVRAAGGEVVVVPYLTGRSTTELVRRIRRAEPPPSE